MRFIIHGKSSDGTEDALVIEGDSVEDIKAKAQEEVDKRGWSDCWSEEIK